MFFHDLPSLGRIVVVGVLAYVALVLMLRISGKRTLSKMNSFDFVVTIALGSTLSTIILDSTISLAEGVVALGVLIGLQFAVAWTCARWRIVERIVKAQPRVVLRDGVFITDAITDERLTQDEVRAAIREAGIANVHDVRQVVLETAGELAVIADGRPPTLPARRSDPVAT